MQYNDVPDLRYSDEAQAISGRFGQQMRRTTTPAYPKVSHFCPKGKACLSLLCHQICEERQMSFVALVQGQVACCS